MFLCGDWSWKIEVGKYLFCVVSRDCFRDCVQKILNISPTIFFKHVFLWGWRSSRGTWWTTWVVAGSAPGSSQTSSPQYAAPTLKFKFRWQGGAQRGRVTIQMRTTATGSLRSYFLTFNGFDCLRWISMLNQRFNAIYAFFWQKKQNQNKNPF